MVSTANAVASAAASRVQAAIYNAATATGVDFGYLLDQASVESSLNPDAHAATSSATGLFQFVEQSWLGTVARHGAGHGLDWAANAITRGSDGRYRIADPAIRRAVLDLRRDPAASAAMAAEFAADNRATLESRLGHAVENVDLYLAHFLGAGGATRFLKHIDAAPGGAAADAFPAAARANRAVFFRADGQPRSFAEIRSHFASRFDGGAPGSWRSVQSASVRPERVDALRSFRIKDGSLTRSARADGGGGEIRTGTQARLAYLMLAGLGVTA